MAPYYSNIFMARLEEHFLLAIHTNLLHTVDILTKKITIMSHRFHHLHSFISNINTQHNNTNYTPKISTTSVILLDLTIDLNVTIDIVGGHISTKTDTRSMDKHSFLSHNCFHHRHIKQPFIYGQFLLKKHICSNDENFLNDTTKLFKYFLARQYLFSNIGHHFNVIKKSDRRLNTKH